MQAHFTGLQPYSVHGVNAKGGNYLLLINLVCSKFKYLEPKYYFLGEALYFVVCIWETRIPDTFSHVQKKHLLRTGGWKEGFPFKVTCCAFEA